MFSSNQVLQISGCLDHEKELYNALEFALTFSNKLKNFQRNDGKSKCVYQITECGTYCIGWSYERIPDGWKEYPFEFDLSIISQIIIKFLSHQEIINNPWDGSNKRGFLMSAIEESLADEAGFIKKPFYGIVEFTPYTCFYSK